MANASNSTKWHKPRKTFSMGEILYIHPQALDERPVIAPAKPTIPNWPPASSAIDFPAFEKLLQSDPAYQVGPNSVAWRINGEIIQVLGWGRAILMQIAHPLVAEGVAAHSHFAYSTADKIKRFEQTLNRMLMMTYGTPEQAWHAGHAIDTIHARVNGEANATHPPYSARDPELLKWVNATFVDSMLKTYTLFVGPLSLEEQNEYVKQASLAGPLLGAPSGYFPSSLSELNTYMQEILASDTLKVGPTTRKLADYVMEGLPIPLIGPALSWYGKLPVIGLLPPSLRKAYGYSWNRADEATLKSSAWTYRRLHPILPARLRRWEIARKAEKAI